MDTVLLVLVVLVALGWVAVAIALGYLASLAKAAAPRLKQLDATLERLEGAIGGIENTLKAVESERLVARVGELLSQAGAAAASVDARVSEMAPVAERLPKLVDEFTETLQAVQGLVNRVKNEAPIDKAREMLERLAELLVKLREVAVNLDDMLLRARETRDTVADGISATKEKMDDAINIIGGVAAGIKAGLRSLADREAGSKPRTE